jgi:casein kinase I homolog HRR25
MGPSLAELLQSFNGTFSLKTVAMLAWQLITRLETIHKRGIVYGNVALDMRMGIGKRSRQVHVVNFDKAQRFKRLKYSPLHVVERSVHADIESLGHTVFALINDPRRDSLYKDYSNSLKNQKPDYDYLRQLFRDLLSRDSIQLDFCFDWMIQSQLPQFDGELALFSMISNLS